MLVIRCRLACISLTHHALVRICQGVSLLIAALTLRLIQSASMSTRRLMMHAGRIMMNLLLLLLVAWWLELILILLMLVPNKLWNLRLKLPSISRHEVVVLLHGLVIGIVADALLWHVLLLHHIVIWLPIRVPISMSMCWWSLRLSIIESADVSTAKLIH